MRFTGRVLKTGRFWAIEVPILDITTQGRTKKEAYGMIADAIETLVDREGFKVRVYEVKGNEFEIGASDQGALTALLLKRARLKAGLSLAEVAARLGSTSPNSYARYEQGKSVPSVEKLNQLFSAVARGRDLVVMESRAPYAKKAASRFQARRPY